MCAVENVIFIGVHWCFNTHVETNISRVAVRRALCLNTAVRCVSKLVMLSFVIVLVLAHLNYRNATLAGLSDQSLMKLQSLDAVL